MYILYIYIYGHSKSDASLTSIMMSNGADASCPQVSGDGFLHKPRPIKLSMQVLAWIIVTTAATTQNHLDFSVGILVLPTHLRKMSRSLSLPNTKQNNNVYSV